MTRRRITAYFMNDLLDGKKQMGVALMEHFGDLFKEAVNDPTPENVKAFADALDEHAKQIKKNDELQAQFEQNVDASETTIEDWAQQHNATPESYRHSSSRTWTHRKRP